MAKIIDGRKLAEQIKDQVTKEIFKLRGPRPNLAIILVGEKEDSCLYVKMKEREAKKVGIDTHLYKCSADIDEREVFSTIDCLNKDNSIDAILVQLPLPGGFDTDGIIQAIDPRKDVDRFHPDNIKELLTTCNHQHVMPPLYNVVLRMLKEIEFDLKQKQACIIANSEIFQKALAKTLECRGAIVDTCFFGDEDLGKKTVKADLVISAVGQPQYITSAMIKKDAVIIDIGITKQDKKVLGDADFEDLKDKAGFISPVPGGVGPMTIACLFENTLYLYKNNKRR